jgi:hypothetical protein
MEQSCEIENKITIENETNEFFHEKVLFHLTKHMV